MAINVTIRPPPTNLVSSVKQNKTTVSSISFVPSPSVSLGQLTNVDAENPDDGEAIIYDATRNEYVVKAISINSNNITNLSGGTF